MGKHWCDPEKDAYYFRQDSGVLDVSSKRVDKADKAPLRYSDVELFEISRMCTGDVIQKVPGFRYWELGEQKRMDRPNNLCGAQQRAFDFYWTIRHGTQRGRVFLGIGTGGVDGPATFGTDKYCGESPSNDDRYGVNGYPYMRVDSDVELPFFDGKFAGVVAHHVIEHLHNRELAVREWLRVTELDGFVCLITPDMAFSPRCQMDATHTYEYAADEFLKWIQSLNLPCKVIEHNTFDNHFSFNTVLQRKGG